MPKNKPHKGLLKRIRVTKSGRVKLHRAFGRHLRSHKPGKMIRKYRQPKYALPAEMGRLKALLGLRVRRPAAAAAGSETVSEPRS